ncbi:FAD-dependent monooxygenase [Pseudarthrobacter raffinosi]|uniref:FAD-dependent monooxygenase n=1 Tax=Pseudarthrobacter raffinosi TaxID=2953651 RepID=UPI00208F8560|nr:FAD-dependent monooxygenase [Pseudarthrobacter sp. MDT3-9]MCO4251242.1 FAD-dependent monooxygenase [Pseudarthrobacter sp. MDT3-9]
MKLSNVHVIGGGPAGLFAAILLRRASHLTRVVVHERSVPDETFGFGVAFTRRTLDILAGASASVVEKLREASVDMPPQEMRIGSHSVQSGGNAGGITIARSALLKALLDQAREVGVEVRLGDEAVASDFPEADLVIAADGVSSATRASLAKELGEHVTPGRGVFMWLGCDRRLETNLFAPARTDAGLFNIHCYPYSNNASTIGVETDLATWRLAGMDVWTADTPLGDSDKKSIDYLQDVFGEILGGATLLGNRSRWMHFRTVTADRWSAGNIVLIGDAAHTAHYSVGSGTKMAMEDAVALVEALNIPGNDDLGQALRLYETNRRPGAEYLQNLADRSRWWWESLEERLHLAPPLLMAAYLSRGGAVSATRLAELDPDLLDSALLSAGLPGSSARPRQLVDDVLSSSINVAGQQLSSRILDDSTPLKVASLQADIHDPWGAEAGLAVEAAVSLAAGGADILVLTGAGAREAVLDRVALAEHIRLRSGAAVAVEAFRQQAEDLVDALIAQRIDLVRFTPANDA